MRLSIRLLVLAGSFLAAAATTPIGGALAQPRGQRPDLTGGFTIARLKYTGGGDWYSDETSLKNLLAALRPRGDVRVGHDKEAVVTATDPELWNYPMLFMTGHGNVKMNDEERAALRAYLEQGGFLWADDNFGLDPSFRALMRQIYPEEALTEVPFSHPIFRAPNPFPGGPPKVHEHDGAPAQVFALHRHGRIVVLYTYSTDIGNGIEDPGIHDDPPEKRDAAMRFAVNIATYALTH
jgi:hypothetical protein